MRTIDVRGVSVPAFMYGTAWKEDDTARCVADAIAVGFRAIDTANQRKHYHEAGVGDGLIQAYTTGVTRGELFLQTKFTYRRGQDARLPYDPRATPAVQVEQSFESSLQHLRTDRLDAYVLHGPADVRGLTDVDRAVWAAFERLHATGKVALLGVSNVSEHHLDELLMRAKVKPAFVQNRCYAQTGWDREVRRMCAANDVVYQGFSLLTANRHIFTDPRFEAIRNRHARTRAQIVFRFAQQLGMLPLTGTTDPAHMREDLLGLDFDLTAEELDALETLG
jgi:diketogulonate reductase-like aldo/keto reductase